MTTGADTETTLELPRGLLLGVVGLATLALLLGFAVLALQLRPAAPPTTQSARDIAAWERIVSEQPDSGPAHAGLGLALQHAGQERAAERAFESALSLDPQDWVALQRLGILLMERDPGRAEELLTTAAEQAPRTNRAPALVALGDLHLDRGDPTAAKAAYERAVGDLPFLIDGHLGLAQALEALGDEDGARAARERAARFDIDDPGARMDVRPGEENDR